MLLDNLMEAKLLGIIGDGNMGWQIATLSALRGYKVFIVGRKEKKNAFIRKSARLFGIVNQQLDIEFTNDIKKIIQFPLIIETINEDLNNKKNILEYLNINSPSSVICTNTSSLNPEDLIINKNKTCMLHFMNPVSSLKFVELAYYKEFQENDLLVKKYIKDIEFEYIQIKPIGGLIANRVLFSYLNVAERLVVNGIEEELTDKVFSLLFGSKINTKKIKKLIGDEVFKKIMENLKSQNVIPN